MTSHFWAVALIGLAGFSIESWAQTSSPQSGAPLATVESDMGSRFTDSRTSSTSLRTLLRRPVDKVEWVETTFEEVLDWLRNLAGEDVNIVPRWNALNADGIDRDSLVTLRLRRTTVAEVLDEVFNQLSEEGQVRYRGERNTLRISTKSDFDRQLVVVSYDVTDILFRIPDMGRSAPVVDLDMAARSGGQSASGGGSGQSVFTGGTSSSSEELEEEEQEVQERLDSLVTMIRRVIAPESWGDTETGTGGSTGGGGPGTIQTYNNRLLVVRNTVEVHEELAGFFKYGQ